VRDPRKMPMQPSLQIVGGDVLDQASLDRVVPGHDAVLFAVGPRHNNESTVRTDGARNTVAAMTKAGVQRLVAMSGLGAGVTRKNLGFMFDQVIARTKLKWVLRDQNGLEGEIRRSKLDWVVVRPGELTDTPPTLKWILSLDGTEIAQKVSRHDVVLFMLDQLQSDDYVRKPVAIGMP
jgi:putative NADH-flavin reductase